LPKPETWLFTAATTPQSPSQSAQTPAHGKDAVTHKDRPLTASWRGVTLDNLLPGAFDTDRLKGCMKGVGQERTVRVSRYSALTPV
jgi:hypothetical protein